MQKLINKPFAPSAVLIATDVAVLIGAIIINTLRTGTEYTYTLTDTAVEMHDPYGWYSVVVVVALIAAAFITAVQIIKSILYARKMADKAGSDKELKGDVAFLVAGSAVLLAISVAVLLFAMWFAVPESPKTQRFFGYSDNEFSIVIAEESFADGIKSAKIYDITYEDDIRLVYTFELNELSDSAERYTLSWAATDILQILYNDAESVRTVQLNFNVLHSDRQQQTQ